MGRICISVFRITKAQVVLVKDQQRGIAVEAIPKPWLSIREKVFQPISLRAIFDCIEENQSEAIA
jgi:hypothetical protein